MQTNTRHLFSFRYIYKNIYKTENKHFVYVGGGIKTIMKQCQHLVFQALGLLPDASRSRDLSISGSSAAYDMFVCRCSLVLVKIFGRKEGLACYGKRCKWSLGIYTHSRDFPCGCQESCTSSKLV